MFIPHLQGINLELLLLKIQVDTQPIMTAYEQWLSAKATLCGFVIYKETRQCKLRATRPPLRAAPTDLDQFLSGAEFISFAVLLYHCQRLISQCHDYCYQRYNVCKMQQKKEKGNYIYLSMRILIRGEHISKLKWWNRTSEFLHFNFLIQRFHINIALLLNTLTAHVGQYYSLLKWLKLIQCRGHTTVMATSLRYYHRDPILFATKWLFCTYLDSRKEINWLWRLCLLCLPSYQ